MTMMLKLLLVMGLLAVSAIVLNKLFPAKDGEAPRSLNDLMDQFELDEEQDAEAEAGSDSQGADEETEPAPAPSAEEQ